MRLVAVHVGHHRHDALVRVGDLQFRGFADDDDPRPRGLHAHSGNGVDHAEAGRLFVIAQQDVDRPRQVRRLHLRQQREDDGREGLHVHRPAAIGPAVGDAQREGSLVHACPVTGTTSVWPDNTTPPSFRGPMVA